MSERVLVTGIEGGPCTGVILNDGDPHYTTVRLDGRGIRIVRAGHPTIRIISLAAPGSDDISNRS